MHMAAMDYRLNEVPVSLKVGIGAEIQEKNAWKPGNSYSNTFECGYKYV